MTLQVTKARSSSREIGPVLALHLFALLGQQPRPTPTRHDISGSTPGRDDLSA